MPPNQKAFHSSRYYRTTVAARPSPQICCRNWTQQVSGGRGRAKFRKESLFSGPDRHPPCRGGGGLWPGACLYRPAFCAHRIFGKLARPFPGLFPPNPKQLGQRRQSDFPNHDPPTRRRRPNGTAIERGAVLWGGQSQSSPCLIGGRTLAGGRLVSVQAPAQACLAKRLSSLRGKACHEKCLTELLTGKDRFGGENCHRFGLACVRRAWAWMELAV